MPEETKPTRHSGGTLADADESAAPDAPTTDVSGIYEQHIFNLVKENNAHLIAIRRDIGKMRFSALVRFILLIVAFSVPFVGAYLALPELVERVLTQKS